MDADADAARARVGVVTRQRDLAAFVEPARFGQCERVGRNDEAVAERAPKRRQPIAVRTAHPPPRNASAYARSRPPG